jgi:viologen exporter family transport system permease protein
MTSGMARPAVSPGPPRIVRIYAALLRAEIAAAAAYRGQLALSVAGWVVPLAFLALWSGAAAAGPVQGITQPQVATYFCFLLVTTSLQMIMPVIFGFGSVVHSGMLSAQLLRPYHPIHDLIARPLARQVYRLPVLLVIVPIALVATGGAVQADAGGWLLAIAITILGTVGTVYLAAMSGALALWMTKSEGIQGLLVGAEWILGGIVAPVALLPGILPLIIPHQPLWYADAAGPEILAGIGDHGPTLLLEAAAWIVALHLLYRWFWRKALRRYEAVGT